MKRWLLVLLIALLSGVALANNPPPLLRAPSYFRRIIGNESDVIFEVRQRFRTPMVQLFNISRGLGLTLLVLGVATSGYQLLTGGSDYQGLIYMLLRLAAIAAFLGLAAPQAIDWDCEHPQSIPAVSECAWESAYVSGVNAFLSDYRDRIDETVRNIGGAMISILLTQGIGFVNILANQRMEEFAISFVYEDIDEFNDIYPITNREQELIISFGNRSPREDVLLGGVQQIIELLLSPLIFAFFTVPYILYVGLIYVNYLGLLVALIFLPIALGVMAIFKNGGAIAVGVIILGQIFAGAIIPLGISVGSLWSINESARLLGYQAEEILEIVNTLPDQIMELRSDVEDAMLEAADAVRRDDINWWGAFGRLILLDASDYIEKVMGNVLSATLMLMRPMVSVLLGASIIALMMLISLIISVFVVMLGVFGATAFITEIPNAAKTIIGGAKGSFASNLNAYNGLKGFMAFKAFGGKK